MAGEKISAEGGEGLLVRASPCGRSPVTAQSTQVTFGLIITPALLSIPSVPVPIFQSLPWLYTLYTDNMATEKKDKLEREWSFEPFRQNDS